MNYNIKGTEVSITSEIRSYLERKLATLEKFFDDNETVRADIELGYLPSQAKTYRAEFTLHGSRLPRTLRVEAEGSTLHESIDIAMGELSREVTQSKKKHTKIFRQSAARVKDVLRGIRNRF